MRRDWERDRPPTHVAERRLPLDPLDIRDALHDLVAADPVIDAISVIEADQTGHLRVFTSTSTEERAEVLELAGRAMATKAPTSDRSNTVFTVRLAGAAARELRRGGHRWSGESAAGPLARAAGRARVRRPHHRARDDPRPLHRPSLMGQPLSAILETMDGNGGRQSARADHE